MSGIFKLVGKINTIFLFAAIVTLSLFYTMQLLIMMEESAPVTGKTHTFENITMPVWEPNVRHQSPRPKEIDRPPEIPINENIAIIEGPPVIQTWKKSGDDIDIDVRQGDFLGPMDGNAMPIAQIQPRYPDNASQRGIEGFVIVEFDVSETGSVINPRIFGSDPLRIFDRAALRAIERWKYNPKIVDGQAVKMFNLKTRFTFNLKE